ncbi:transcriptional regulator [Campylobacter sp. LH-2024]|uniref:helix-turn-helix transcriptional regulator n=1 Tax=Campylobacter TaxID=194 RepID=UPI001D803DFE|nr:PAS domain-containing protein [Campylobacter sp. W0067]MBZ7931701.1 PAS domain-containing protein [Campylobacter sp. RM12910]MBZ7933155.1 PAS domain-containing protein [Campylobacter sp. RM10543]MBZ7945543.1 PAS domain-containing protein [Campylobacter sp. RM10532]MBZ7951038.1 PAS domain-containing protein [Campylobacter sp. W0046]MBZ7960024.1 PAS domain-containing protein [Campylobacter sp. RM12397]MBZ7961394.1 PAS domain-containing protein [Campylobacter sp. RM9930]MBZ7962882.1 PAS doma
MDEKQKEQFIKLTKFLGQVLGKQYEVVFHVIDKKGTYIAAIENNHISGRTLESPLDAFISELIQKKVYLKKDFLYDYKALVEKNKFVRGSTFFIKNSDELVGILCINHDASVIRDAICKIIDIEKLDDMGEFLSQDESSNLEINDLANVETLSRSIEEILAQNIDMSYLNSNYQLSITQKEEIAKTLYEKGIFNIKGAVAIVAKFLKISEPSVYRYLKKFKK